MQSHHVTHSILELFMWLWLALNSKATCFSILITEVTGVLSYLSLAYISNLLCLCIYLDIVCLNFLGSCTEHFWWNIAPNCHLDFGFASRISVLCSCSKVLEYLALLFSSVFLFWRHLLRYPQAQGLFFRCTQPISYPN